MSPLQGLVQLLLWFAPEGAVRDPANPAQLAPLYARRVEQVAEQKGDVARAASEAAGFFLSLGRMEEAARFARQALAIDEAALGANHVRVAEHMELLASASPAEWLTLAERALAIRTSHPPSAALARLHSRLAAFYDARRAPKVAMDHYRAAVAVHRKVTPPDELAHAVAMNDLGLALEGESKFGESEALYRRALAIQERRLGARHPETGITLNNLAGALGATGRTAQAEPVLRRALAILESKLGPEHTRTATCAHNLGDLLAATGRRNLALPLYQKALAAFEKAGDAAGAAEVRASLRRAQGN